VRGSLHPAPQFASTPTWPHKLFSQLRIFSENFFNWRRLTIDSIHFGFGRPPLHVTGRGATAARLGFLAAAGGPCCRFSRLISHFIRINCENREIQAQSVANL
jgi:hypothetical protein